MTDKLECTKCKKEFDEITYFNEYHPFYKAFKEEGQYCDKCFKLMEKALAEEYLEVYGEPHDKKRVD